uniref:Chitin-binding type-2 domain-containing protein n=1 Tax=Octopus bimaculoides TaxID=37653 RepID=A0A0L8FXX5_OCTBM
MYICVCMYVCILACKYVCIYVCICFHLIFFYFPFPGPSDGLASNHRIDVKRRNFCIFPSTENCVACEDGFYEDKDDCGKFFLCNFGGLIRMDCQKGWYWSMRSESCVHGRNC